MVCGFPPQGISALLKEALVVYKGTTTSVGAAGGSTLVCSALTAKADWNGNQIIITSGDYEGQARDINGTTNNVTGTVTVATVFSGQIPAGVTFVVTGIRTVPAEVASCLAILESDSRKILSTALTAPTVNSLTRFIASGGTGLGQPLPASTSLIDLLGNFTGPYNGAAQDDNVKASLDLVHTDLGAIIVDTDEKSVGKAQIASTTIDLDQIAGTYDLFTGTTQDVLLEALTIRLPNVNVSDDATITSISIQTDDVTAHTLIASDAGAKASLTAEAQLAYPMFCGSLIIKIGTKIQLTIAGGAADATTVCDVVARYRAVTSGGYLA